MAWALYGLCACVLLSVVLDPVNAGAGVVHCNGCYQTLLRPFAATRHSIGDPCALLVATPAATNGAANLGTGSWWLVVGAGEHAPKNYS